MFRLIRLMTLAPGHFHAALVQKRATYGIHPRTHVYGPLDRDMVAHITYVESFNNRIESPTAWEIDLRAGGNYLQRFVQEQPGNTLILSGRNRPKIDLMHLGVENGLHVLADKPWIIEHADFPKLETLFRNAELREVLVWDMLTERFEITNWLQRELIRDPEVFGAWQCGSREQPALTLQSVHRLKKTVNGQPLIRPWWWFDPAIAGESMADVGTHLADLALGFIAPDEVVDYATQIQMLAANHSPLLLSRAQFREVTGLASFPAELRPRVVAGELPYTGNHTASLTLRGIHVRLNTAWEFDSAGGDTHQSSARGTRATISVRQQPCGPPELFVEANDARDHKDVLKYLRGKCDALQRDFAGLSAADLGSVLQLLIPADWRSSHEDHFAAVMDEFVRYFHAPHTVPAWEQPNALARYYITTKAVEMARQ